MEQGATPEQIVRVAEAFGMPIRPIAMRDMSGLDVGMMVRETRKATLPEGERFSPSLQRLVERGRLGMKSGQGFYRYEGRQKFPDPETTQIIADAARELGIERPTRRSSSACSPPGQRGREGIGGRYRDSRRRYRCRLGQRIWFPRAQGRSHVLG